MGEKGAVRPERRKGLNESMARKEVNKLYRKEIQEVEMKGKKRHGHIGQERNASKGTDTKGHDRKGRNEKKRKGR